MHAIERRRDLRLTIGFTGPLVVWLSALSLGTALAETACAMSTPWPLHATNLGGALLAGFLGWTGWRARPAPSERAGGEKSPTSEPAARAERAHFMAVSSLVLGGAAVLLLLGNEVANVLLHPCTR